MLSKNISSPEVMSNLKTQVDKMEQIVAVMKKNVENVKSSSQKSTDNVRKVITQIANIETRVNNSDLDKLSGKMDKIREMIEERFNLMMKLVDRKSDGENLIKVDKKFTEQLSDINEMLDKFADKEEMLRRIIFLEKQVKRLLDRPVNVTTSSQNVTIVNNNGKQENQ